MAKTKEEKREYDRLAAQRRRAKLKAEGKPLNNPETVKKAINKYNQEKRKKGLTNKLFSNVSLEILEMFEEKKGNKTDVEFFEELVRMAK